MPKKWHSAGDTKKPTRRACNVVKEFWETIEETPLFVDHYAGMSPSYEEGIDIWFLKGDLYVELSIRNNKRLFVYLQTANKYVGNRRTSLAHAIKQMNYYLARGSLDET